MLFKFELKGGGGGGYPNEVLGDVFHIFRVTFKQTVYKCIK